MTTTPYPISGKVYDIDGSTALSGVTVTMRNTTQEERLKPTAIITSNSSGEYVIDAANFPSGYEDGDILHIEYFIAGRFLCTRHTIVVATGSLEQDAYLVSGNMEVGDCQWRGGIFTNSSAGGLYVDLYDKTDVRKIRIEVPAGSTVTPNFGTQGGITFSGGITPILESVDNGDITTVINQIDGTR